MLADSRSCRCFPHVVNICVQHVLAAFEDNKTIDKVPESSWKEAAQKKPLSRLRALIRALRASGKRCEAFSESIREGNSKGLFVDPEACQHGEMKSVHVPECNLLRDVDTRWDSVYYMIKRARILRPVSLFFLCQSSHLKLRRPSRHS